LHEQNILAVVFPSINGNHALNPFEVISLIRSGATNDALDRVAQLLDVPKSQLCNILHLSHDPDPHGIVGRLDVKVTDHLVQIVRLYKRGLEALDEPAKTTNWLKSPNFSLGGHAPLELIDTIEGICLVQDALIRLEHGVYS
jgi:putative toxin-antitoxin system antitoxin component (TIGR02293 family)